MIRESALRYSSVSAVVLGIGSILANVLADDLRWSAAEGYRFASVNVASNAAPLLELIPPSRSGITFSNRLSDGLVSTNRLTEIGSGVALGDIDADGRVDIYFCRLEGNNVMYRNLGGWKFQDVTAQAGVACENQFSTGAVLADIDGDDDLDLLVNSLGGGTRAFLNNGKGQFTEMTDSRLVRRYGATSMALADVDGDSDLDLYVTNYRTDTFHDHPPGLKIVTRRGPSGELIVEPVDRFLPVPVPNGGLELLERGESDFLYINRGEGRFSPARWDVGTFLDENGKPIPEIPTDWGLSVMFRDLNGDRLPDLYVCNDFVFWPDRIWLNQQGKRFRAAPVHMFRNMSLSSMSVDVADINRDGYDDIFVADMLSPRRESRLWQRPDTLAGVMTWPTENPAFTPEVNRNTLQLARDNGTYAEIAALAGVAATDWTWGVAFLDVDLDGWEDLLLVTGNNHDVQDADVLEGMVRSADTKTAAQRLRYLQKMPRRETASLAFRNRRDLTFEDASARWGFNAIGIAHGLALGDLDNDGDLDVVVNTLNTPARVYRNNSTAPRLAVRLKGSGKNTRGIGAKIRVVDGPVPQSQEMLAGGRYCSGDDAMRVFAAGRAERVRIEVTWRNGRRSAIEGAEPNRVYEIAESAAQDGAEAVEPATASITALFEDVSSRINHAHVDEPFDDFKHWPLLPRKLSSLGPGVAWADLDLDGDDDLVISGGKGGRLTVFKNDGVGAFQEWPSQMQLPPNSRDQTALVAVPMSSSGVRLFASESTWEESMNRVFGGERSRSAATTDSAGPSVPRSAGAGADRDRRWQGVPGPIRTFEFNAGTLNQGAETTPETLFQAGPLASADIDSDGDLDLFVGGRVSAGRYPESAPSILLRNDEGVWKQIWVHHGLCSGAVLSDLDADGDPDLALACEWDSIRVWRNEAGNFTDVTESMGLAHWKGWWNGISAGDFDEDGRMDLAASNWGRNWRVDQPQVESGSGVTLFYGDFGDTGIMHTIVASEDSNLGKVTPWRERRALAAIIPSLAERFPSYRAFARADVLEILGERGGSVRRAEASRFESMVFLNRGDHFEARPLPPEAQFAPGFGISVADFDGDGHEDLFMAQNFFGVDPETSRQDAGIGVVLLGDGSGRFRALSAREAGFAVYGEQRGSAVSDFDGDGRVDLVVGQNGGETKLLRNRRARPGLRVALKGRGSNPTGIGAVVRVKSKAGLGPAKEVHAGSGFGSQDSATLVLATADEPVGIWVRWPGGKIGEYSWPEKAKDGSADGVVRISED